MKKQLVAIAMISTLVGCSVPITSHAADVKVLKSGSGYVVIGGQGADCLQQTLDKINAAFGNGSIICPGTPSQPDSTQPETPSQPDSSKPETPSQPDSSKPETPSQPDSSKPETPSQPDSSKPETPSQPDSSKPETPSQPDSSKPDDSTSDEDAVHDFALEVLKLVNEERAKAGLSALKLDTGVTAAANVRAKEIKQQFSHTRPNGSSYSTALTEQGVSYMRSGENIAWGQKSPEQVMNAWMNSEGHRANILNKNFQNIGIGYYQDANGVNYWVQLFTA